MGYDSWEYTSPDRERATHLEQEGYLPLTAAFLAARGFSRGRDVKERLSVPLSGLHDPFLLEDMQTAVDRIHKALSQKETIAVYGDYDADGITAVALMVRELTRLGAQPLWYLPDRVTEGYGLNQAGMEKLAQGGATLLITVDTGSNAHKEAPAARQLGMDVIITDHHECKATLPEAVAVLNPRRPQSAYPFDGLAGVGVAFKLLCALTGDGPGLLSRYGDLIALGTVADVMPVLDENRVLITHGLEVMARTRNLGLKALLNQPECNGKPVNAALISFTVAPRINAAGRLGKADIALSLLLCNDPARAQEGARTLCELNAQRQIMERDMLDTALELLDLTAPALIPASADFHIGIAGIVAARLAIQYDRPVFLICIEGEVARGSARSISGVNIIDILTEVSDTMTTFGGHAGAAGFSLPVSALPAFREAVLACCRHRALTAQSILPLDGEVLPQWIDLPGVAQLETLAPFGSGFPSPAFCLCDAYVQSVTPLSGGKHIRLTLQKGGILLNAIWFGHTVAEAPSQNMADIAFRPEINHFRGTSRPQLYIIDLRPSQWQQEAERQFEIYCRFVSRKAVTPQESALLLPDREDMVAVWRSLGRLGTAWPEGGLTPIWLAYRFMEAGAPRDMGKVWVSLDVLCEMKLCHRQDCGNGHFCVWRQQGQDKIDLTRSKLLNRLRRLSEGDVTDAT